MAWARKAGAQPNFAVNLGTRGVDAARNLVEYCNAPAGSRYADWRVENGHADPYDIKLWCLGNEMDGPWQVGSEDGGRVRPAGGRGGQGDAARRPVDRAAAWSAAPTRGCRPSAHGRTRSSTSRGTSPTTSRCTATTTPANYPDLDAYLACSLDLDRMIDTVVATADAVAGRKRSRKRIGISVDEWNVWHQQANPHHTDSHGPVQARAAPARGRPDAGRRARGRAAC
jgi:alpha-N-arabinofuranosidase